MQGIDSQGILLHFVFTLLLSIYIPILASDLNHFAWVSLHVVISSQACLELNAKSSRH
jgi:hypothetical protein